MQRMGEMHLHLLQHLSCVTLQDVLGGPLPALALPERFQLVFRDSGGGSNAAAVSIWRPIPPKG